MWRKTPQTLLIKQLLTEKGHATNQELARLARQTFPNLTNTSVHRITTRLVDAKMASYAPNLSGLKVLDTNLNEHDHFYCLECDTLTDVKVTDECYVQLQKQLKDGLARKNILVAGVCNRHKQTN
jgi:Fe2+ or Zn2+ uptake regulation protein